MAHVVALSKDALAVELGQRGAALLLRLRKCDIERLVVNKATCANKQESVRAREA